MKKIKLARFAFKSTAEKFVELLQDKFFVVGTYTIEPSDHERGNFAVMFEHSTKIKTKKILEYVIELLTTLSTEIDSKEDKTVSNKEIEITQKLNDVIPLDDETTQKFLYNCLYNKNGVVKLENKEQILNSILVNGFSETLRLAFEWATSPERYFYWMEIYIDTISQKEIFENPDVYNQYKRIFNSEIYDLIPLESDIARKFIINSLSENNGSDRFKTVDEIKEYIESYGFKSCLFHAFNWKLSPEKGKFWSKIFESLK